LLWVRARKFPEPCDDRCVRLPSKTLQKDPNQLAAEVVELSTGEPTQLMSQYLAKMGRNGGLKGGKVRAQGLTADERKAIAKKAAKARWSKKHV
jgi:hypothetical protein